MTVYGFKNKQVARRLLELQKETRGLGQVQQGPQPKAVPIRWDEWVFVAPAGGVPAAVSQSQPGTADCQAYYINDLGSLLLWTSPEGNNATITVYNVADSVIAENTVFTAINVAGKPVAIVGGGFDCLQLCDCEEFFPAQPNFA